MMKRSWLASPGQSVDGKVVSDLVKTALQRCRHRRCFNLQALSADTESGPGSGTPLYTGVRPLRDAAIATSAG